jgi:hypothetical protein
MAEHELLDVKEYWRKRTENRHCGRYLPVEVSAHDPHAEGGDTSVPAVVYHQTHGILVENQLDCMNREVLHCGHRLREAWDGEAQLIRKCDFELAEDRGAEKGSLCKH